MGLFDDVKNTVVGMGKDISKSAKDTTDIAKIRMEVKKKEGIIENLYRAIGQAYFEQHKDDEEPGFPQVTEIKTALAEIAALEAEEKTIKGVVICPNCGATISSTAAFCGTCGQKLN